MPRVGLGKKRAGMLSIIAFFLVFGYFFSHYLT
jgi:hypothetical protein